MGLPPKLSTEQRQAALVKAALSRKRRAEIKAQVKSAVMTIDDVLELAVVFLIVSFATRFSLVSNRNFDRRFWCGV